MSDSKALITKGISMPSSARRGLKKQQTAQISPKNFFFMDVNFLKSSSNVSNQGFRVFCTFAPEC